MYEASLLHLYAPMACAYLFCAVERFNQHSQDDLLITTDEISDHTQIPFKGFVARALEVDENRRGFPVSVSPALRGMLSLL
jgi:hypothetical protein